MGYKVFVRDVPHKDGRMPLVGEVDTWLRLEFNVRFNAPGHWQMTVQAGTHHELLLRQGRGIVVFQDEIEEPVFSGTIDGFDRQWTSDSHSGKGSVIVNGKDDNQIPYNYLCFPSTVGEGDQVKLRRIDKQWEGMDQRPAGGTVGRAIWQECALAFGDRALPDRQMKQVDVGQSPEVGDEIKDTLRYDNMGAKFEEWLKGKNTGFRLLYDPNSQKIRLKVAKCRNLSRTIRFSPELGNIKQYSWQLTAPRVTRAVVACQGEGKDRYIYQASDLNAEYLWGRVVEQFIDRRDIPLKTVRGRPELVVRLNEDGSQDLGTGPEGKPWPGNTYGDRKDAAVKHFIEVVREAARTALKEGEKLGHFQLHPIDTPQCMYARDYVVGDIVSVEADEKRITEKVNEVTISVDEGSDGSVTPKIGEQGTGSPLNLYKQIAEMRQKILMLESRM